MLGGTQSEKIAHTQKKGSWIDDATAFEGFGYLY